jgi:serine/threonine protein phosphatase PrpC
MVDIAETRKLAGVNVGIVHANGGRTKQQDAFFAVDSAPRDSDIIPYTLSQKFDDVTHKTEDYYDDGSTATVAVVSPDNKLSLAYLGDSPAFLFERDKTTGEVTCKTLIEHPHLPTDSEEIKHIMARGGTAEDVNIKGKIHTLLDGRCTLSRGFGLNDVEHISHEPDHSITIDLAQSINDPNKQVFLCVATDGIYTHDQNFGPADFCQIIKDVYKDGGDHGQREKRVAEQMAEAAEAFGISDNKTVLFAELKPNRDKELILGAFDGLGNKGEEVSQFAAKTLQESLVNKVERSPSGGVGSPSP